MADAVRLHGICRYFQSVTALDGVDLHVDDGEFFGLLGPSGSGKTTCLRLIAGFDKPSAGTIEIAGKRCETVPPYRRDVSTVFQDYALFPHMNVIDNVAYGLMVRGEAKTARLNKARDALALVKLDGFEQRRPSELSGGQRQRVALARSIVTQPKVLLLDEPLGALDLKLREQMQAELKSLQRELAITFIFVTHDQGEALSMSDRIAIFNAGRIMQIGAPETVYERPANAFVADFVGGSNVIDAQSLKDECAHLPRERAVSRGSAYSLRPEKIRFGVGPQHAVNLTGVVSAVQYQGASHRITLQSKTLTLNILRSLSDTGTGDQAVQPGSALAVWFDPADLHPMSPT